MSTSVTSFGAQAPSATTLPTIVKWKPSATGAAAFPILDIGTAGQVLTVNAGATDFSWVTPSATPLSPNVIGTATGTLVAGQPNIIESTLLCTVTLPATCPLGQTIQIACGGISSLLINLTGSQSIICPGGQTTTPNGSVGLATNGSSLTMMCVLADEQYVVMSNTNVLTVV